MYHHRYQPQTSHLADKTNKAINNQSINSRVNTNSTKKSYHIPNSRSDKVSSLANSTVTSAAGAAVSTPTAESETTAYPNSVGSGGSNSFNNYSYINPATTYSSPFSSLPKQFVEERQDVIFRRVRGILNKITPETFDKLTKELVNVGLDSPRTLRGVIYLLFDKALKDLKYSSLYAKLCQELSEKAPNFEQEPGPNTFCKFLISKCEDEFERRRKATEDFDSKNELTDEEFEQKSIAKQKMLGNIKFICELGKKRLLQEEILHECIRGLLSKKKKERPIQDQAQDLECLCQIMRTIGSLLDVEASRNLMNQYFERIEMYSKKQDLPSRIRFMLKDVIDLRNNNWRPRPFQREDNVPQPLSKLREELGYNNIASNSTVDKLGNKTLLDINDLVKLSGNKLNSLLLDDEPTFTTTTDFHWGSSLPSDNPDFDWFSNPTHSSRLENGLSATADESVLSGATRKQQYQEVSASVPKGQSKLGIFSDYKFPNMNNRIDPFSDSFKSKHNSSNNSGLINNIDNRMTVGDNSQLSFFTRRHESQNIKSAGGDPPLQKHGQPLPFERLNDVNTQPNLFGRDSSAHQQARNNVSYQNNPHHANRNIPNRNDRQFNHNQSRQFIHNERQSFEESHGASEPYSRRINDLTLDSNQPPVRFKKDEMMPSSTTSQLLPSQHQCPIKHQAPNDVQLTENQAHHLRDCAKDELNKDKRFNRNVLDRHDIRPQRFVNNNSRQPIRDRAQPNQLAMRNRVPESERNQNWRATAAPPKKLSHVAQLPADQMHPAKLSDTLPESKIDKLPSTYTLKDAIIEKPIDLVEQSNDKQALENAPSRNRDGYREPPSTSNGSNLPVQGMRNGELKPSMSSTRNDFKPINCVDGPISKTVELRRDLDSKQATQCPPNQQVRRLAQNRDLKDKKDIPRRSTGPMVEFDGRIYQRPYQNESGSLERRNFRPHIARNQSFDAPNKIEAKKSSVAKPDGIVIGSTPSILKDTATCAMTNSFFPPTQIKMNNGEFSLRPSHNLTGRATSSQAAPKSSNQALGSASEVSGVAQSVNRKSDSTPQAPTKITCEIKNNSPVELASKKDAVRLEPSKVNYVDQFRKFFVFNKDQQEISKIVPKIKELKVPKQYQTECLVELLKKCIIKTDNDRVNTCRLLAQIIPSSFDACSLISAFQIICEQLQGMEVDTPKVKSLVAGLLSQSTAEGLISIVDVANMFMGGKHHPLFLLYLQKLEKINGKAWLSEKFIASKVKLMDMLPEVDRSKERLASALKDRCLGFLDPMLTIEPDLWEHMKTRDPAPAAVYRWIKENVDQSIQGTTTFAHVFVRCLLKYIHHASMEKLKSESSSDPTADGSSNESQSSKSSPTNVIPQVVSDNEKELLAKYQHILQAILKDKSMQLASLYAIQAFYHSLDFPKGAILRWFHLFYDMSIVDDDVYFTWKEEINDKYPGKGQALFQVNAWLHWLAEAESEEEEE